MCQTIKGLVRTLDATAATHRHTDTPTHRHTDTPTHRHTDTPTHNAAPSVNYSLTEVLQCQRKHERQSKLLPTCNARNSMFRYPAWQLRRRSCRDDTELLSMFPKPILTYVLTHLLTYSLTYLLTYLLTHSLTYSLTYSLTHSLTHFLTYVLTHSLTH
jgi:hypothetical protein